MAEFENNTDVVFKKWLTRPNHRAIFEQALNECNYFHCYSHNKYWSDAFHAYAQECPKDALHFITQKGMLQFWLDVRCNLFKFIPEKNKRLSISDLFQTKNPQLWLELINHDHEAFKNFIARLNQEDTEIFLCPTRQLLTKIKN